MVSFTWPDRSEDGEVRFVTSSETLSVIMNGQLKDRGGVGGVGLVLFVVCVMCLTRSSSRQARPRIWA